MYKILFVDDDINLLNGIKRGLRNQGKTWEMYFIPSAEQALEFLVKKPVDVLVSDFKMPEMTGIELLSIVEALYPRVLRVLLTGHSEKIKYSQTVNICHYFFCKPFKIHGFVRLLERTSLVLKLIGNNQLMEQLNAISSLPVHDESFDRLQSCFGHYDTRTEQLVHIAGKDIGLSLLLFKLSSSANFSSDLGIRTLAEAADFLDMNTFRSLMGAGQILPSDLSDISSAAEINRIQKHSFQTVQIAEALARTKNLDNKLQDIRLAALLHDCGHIIVSHVLPGVYAQIYKQRDKYKNEDFVSAEEQIIGTNHAEIGAYLAALWGVPQQVFEAILHHVDNQPPILERNPVSHIIWHANRLALGITEQSNAYYSSLIEDCSWQNFFNRIKMADQVSCDGFSSK